MSKAFTPKVVTANALLEGDVVWLTQDNTWTRTMAKAELMTDAAHADLRLIDAQAWADKVVGVYLVDAKAGANGPEPVHFRETFRTRGPSNYAHGKQAEQSFDETL
jgi:hypothetical protein